MTVTGLHTVDDPAAAIRTAQALFVGGGNTFRLVKRLQQDGLLPVIKDAVRSGLRYLGASAGTNIAAPTLSTTNDMPIVEPDGFATLGLIPFQLNCHYLDPNPGSNHAGETRELRLQEYLEENPGPVLALREGTHLRVTSDHDEFVAEIGGTAVSPKALGPARLFTRDQITEIAGQRLAYRGGVAAASTPEAKQAPACHASGGELLRHVACADQGPIVLVPGHGMAAAHLLRLAAPFHGKAVVADDGFGGLCQPRDRIEQITRPQFSIRRA